MVKSKQLYTCHYTLKCTESGQLSMAPLHLHFTCYGIVLYMYIYMYMYMYTTYHECTYMHVHVHVCHLSNITRGPPTRAKLAI